MDYRTNAESIMDDIVESRRLLTAPFNHHLIEGPQRIFPPEEKLPVAIDTIRLIEDAQVTQLTP